MFLKAESSKEQASSKVGKGNPELPHKAENSKGE
jgi:hypothetical protein